MDTYFPKTRRPNIASVNTPKVKLTPVKRKAESVTPPLARKIPNTPSTPTDAKIVRSRVPPPPPVKQKKERPITVRELFASVHPLKDELPVQPLDRHTSSNNTNSNHTNSVRAASPLASSSRPAPPITPTTTASNRKSNSSKIKRPARSTLKRGPLFASDHVKPAAEGTSAPLATPLVKDPIANRQVPQSPSKIQSGPLKGVSSSLLDLIRAKEAAAKANSPMLIRRRELLGIAPEVVRIVPTVFTASKKEVILYDKVIDKCFKGLRSNYTSETIIECLDLMDKIAPDWVSVVTISRGKFMRINRDKYNIPQLLKAIDRFKETLSPDKT